MEIVKKVFKVTIFGNVYELTSVTNAVRRKHSARLADDNIDENTAIKEMLYDVGLPNEVYDEMDDEDTVQLLQYLSGKKK